MTGSSLPSHSIMSLVKDYLAHHKRFCDEYGANTVVLMQVGAFFEVYGLRQKDGSITGSNIEAFSRTCDLIIASKKACVGQADVVMAGFRDYMLDKYLKRLQENGFTTAVYSQDTPSKNTTRSLSGIYSPGTYFSAETKTLSNNATCIWLFCAGKNVHIGVANVDIFTGRTAAFEFTTTDYHNPTSFDELERYISVYDPAELIFVHQMDEARLDDIITFAGANERCIHRIDLGSESNRLVKMAKNCEKQTYQNEILARFGFGADGEHQAHLLFGEHALCATAFCFLLDYVHCHNPDLVNRLQPPVLENKTDRVLLANHSLKQLNMVDDSQYVGKLSSVSRFLNNCVTNMGRRRFHYKVLNPIVDCETLEESYDVTEHLTGRDDLDWFRSTLRGVKDIEKLERKRLLRRITPFDFAQLHDNLLVTVQLAEKVADDVYLTHKIEEAVGTSLAELTQSCTGISECLDEAFDLSKCRGLDTLNFHKRAADMEAGASAGGASEEADAIAVSFVRRGVCERIDAKVRANLESRDKLECIRALLNTLVASSEKKSKTTDFVKIHETPTLGTSIQATKRRAYLLKTQICSLGITPTRSTADASFVSRFDQQDHFLAVELLDIQDVPATGSTMNITSPQIRDLVSKIRSSKEAMVDEITHFYMDFMKQFETHATALLQIASFVTWIDVFVCQAHNAIKYNYCRPSLVPATDKSYVRTTGLRHCLIEHLQTREVYVANDVELGDGADGALLYGTNAVGKTSLIRALGIACVLAQSGMFVPASSFETSPYSSLFTRILGNDNLFKGMSTFAVEMSELRTILRLADAKSLILGDELCSGTESDSALSIFTAGVEALARRGSSFLFATHFHQLVDLDEIKALHNLRMFHMSVSYDAAAQKLIYDRKVKSGPGDNMYGLEVCKSLQLPADFLERAHDIRMKYRPATKPVSSLGTSRYNSKKVVGMCELCEKSPAQDTHHLRYQKDACKSGHIDQMHKNHPANLAALCKECHVGVHRDNAIYKRVRTSMGYQLLKEDDHCQTVRISSQ